jgi:hypothetical protein
VNTTTTPSAHPANVAAAAAAAANAAADLAEAKVTAAYAAVAAANAAANAACDKAYASHSAAAYSAARAKEEMRHHILDGYHAADGNSRRTCDGMLNFTIQGVHWVLSTLGRKNELPLVVAEARRLNGFACLYGMDTFYRQALENHLLE